MIKHLKLLFILLLSTLFSCIDGRAPSGINTRVFYSEGDCMPPINISTRVYKPYVGNEYIVEKSIAGQFNDSSFDSLKTISIVTEAVNGGISVLVVPGSYYIIPDTMFCLSCDNFVTIKKDELIEKEFKFFKCTSY